MASEGCPPLRRCPQWAPGRRARPGGGGRAALEPGGLGSCPTAAPGADRSRGLSGTHRCNSHSPPPPQSHRHPLGLSVTENLLEPRLDLTVPGSEAHRGSMSPRAVQTPQPGIRGLPSLAVLPTPGPRHVLLRLFTPLPAGPCLVSCLQTLNPLIH